MPNLGVLAGASSQDISPAQQQQWGLNPRAQPGQGEEKQLGGSGAMLLANNGVQTPLIFR